jgi:carboxyl-terminal processing protease
MSSKFKSIGLVFLGMVVGITLSFQFSALADKSTGTPLPIEKMREFTDVFGLIKSIYVEPVEDKKLLTDALTGMVNGLDAHSSYMNKEEAEDLDESIQGSFVGIGIDVEMDDGYVKIVAPIEGSPAERAGVKAGDLITRIDSTLVKGLSLEEAIKRMRGAPKSKITLTIVRKTEDKPLVMSIVREVIKQSSIKGKIVESGYAWLRVTQFQDPTLDDFVKKAQELYAQDRNLKGLVLDLRNDPGGLVDSAVGIAAAFLPKDVVVVSTKGQIAEANEVLYAKREFYAKSPQQDPLVKMPKAIRQLPLVVLVNSGSASASEIVAGALQDHKRATILGTQSFGKGSVQTVTKFPANSDKPEFAVKLTIARYYTPNGRSIQAKGIVPDLIVDETADGDGLNTIRTREADLQKHLQNEKDKDGGQPQVDELEEEQRLNALAKNSKPVEYGSKDDYQLAQALNFLKGLPVKVSKAEVASVDASPKK